MPQLRPFRGLRYAPSAVANYSAVICPPFDVISAAERERLAARHPANAVRLELPDSYEVAAAALAAWRADGTLRLDDRPLIYMYEQRYQIADGPPARSLGFFCRLGLRSDEGTPVRPHEQTLARPKEDRFALLKAVRTNLSPVVLLWTAPRDLALAELYAELIDAPPDTDAVDDAGVRHLLWPADPESHPAAARLLAAAEREPLTIADGHHRFATAQRYCAEVGGEGSDSVMAVLFESASAPAVLATHRLLSIDAVGGVEIDVLARARKAFTTTPAQTEAQVVPREPGRIGLWTRAGGALLDLPVVAAQSVLESLDVSALSAAYPALVGATAGELIGEGRIVYTQEAAGAVAFVQQGDADAAFLLAATPLQAILDVAAAGQFMPPKSTFFYPKAATGLVFNVLST